MRDTVAHALLPAVGVWARSPWLEFPVGSPIVAAFSLCLAAACERQPRTLPVVEPPPAPTSENSIHVGPLSGKIDGKAYTAKTARYYIDRRPGYEKVDIKLYGAGSKTPCGELDEAKPPSVWLRRLGADKVGPQQSTTTVQDGGEWEVHYQIQDDGFWIGNGEANALVVIEGVGADLKLAGVLSACFRDTTGSCVAGEFSASFCTTSFDEPVRGTEAMERPTKVELLVPAPSAALPAPSASAGQPAPSPRAPSLAPSAKGGPP